MNSFLRNTFLLAYLKAELHRFLNVCALNYSLRSLYDIVIDSYLQKFIYSQYFFLKKWQQERNAVHIYITA